MTLGNLRKRRRTRAVALLTAMVVCLFLFLLTGALIQTQSGAFAVAQSSDARSRARLACQSLYDYCLYQLEHDRDWGKDRFATVGAVDPDREQPGGLASLGSRVEITEVEGRVFRGYLPEHETGFEVEVHNALTTPSGLTSGGLSTPHEHARLSIVAWEGRDAERGSRSRQQVDCLLRLAPLYDGSVLSRGDMSVSANEVLFASKDPFRNEVRAEGDITLPGLTQGRTRFVVHNQEVIREDSDLDDMGYDKTGMLWAGKDIGQETGVISSGPAAAANLGQAAERSGGRMVPDAASRADIYDLRPENIPQPTFAPDRDIHTPPGEFRFTKAMATVRYEEKVGTHQDYVWVEREKEEPIDVLEYYDPPDSPEPLKVMRRDPKALDTATQRFKSMDVDYGPGRSNDVPVVVGDRFYMDNDRFQTTVDVTDINGNTIQVPEMGFRRAGNGGDGPVAIDLVSQTVMVESATRVRPTSRPEGSSLPPSAFQLTVKEGRGGMPQLPTFKLGNGNDVVVEADGDIAVGAGFTKGLGTFISRQGSVTLNPIAQELKWVEKYFNGVPYWVLENEVDLQANANYAGLVVYAEKDVRIANIADADWSVRGFVYARGNFEFDVGDHNATFFGSVVAGNNPLAPGRFHIDRADRATFIYDPEYLKLLTRQLPRNWTRVEPLVWSEANG